MRIFRKVLLAAGLIGALSTLGFVSEARADVTVTPSGTYNDKLVITSSTAGADRITVKAGDREIVSNETLPTTGYTIESLKALVDQKLVDYDTVKDVTTLTVEATSTTDTTIKESRTYTLTPALYKVVAKVDDANNTVKMGSKSAAYVAGFYYKGESVSIAAVSGDSFVFNGWDNNSKDNPLSVTVSDSAITLTASFKRIAPDYIILAAKYGSKDPVSGSLEVPKNTTVTFSVGLNYGKASDYTYKFISMEPDLTGYFSGQRLEWKSGSKATDVPVTFTVTYGFGEKVNGEYPCVLSSSMDLTIKGGSEKKDDDPDFEGDIKTSGFVEYITKGYKLEFKVESQKDSDGDYPDLSDMSGSDWKVTEGDEYVKDITVSKAKEKEATVTIEFKDDIDFGDKETKAVKVRCLHDDDEDVAYEIDDKEYKEVTIYKTPTSSFDTSTYSINYKQPAKVNTGTKSGTESDNSSSTTTAISSVSGAYVSIGVDAIPATTATKSGVSGTLDEATLKKVMKDLVSKKKLTSDSSDVTYRLYPQGESKHNVNVYSDTTVKLYRVVIKYSDKTSSNSSGNGSTKNSTTTNSNDDSGNTGRRSTTGATYSLPVAFMDPAANLVATATTTSAVKEAVAYGAEGQTLKFPDDFVDLPAGTSFSSLSNGFEDVASKGQIVVSSSTARNTYAGVLGARSSSGGSASANDSTVGKWGQNNMPVYLMIAVVVATAVLGMTAYDRKRKNY